MESFTQSKFPTGEIRQIDGMPDGIELWEECKMNELWCIVHGILGYMAPIATDAEIVSSAQLHIDTDHNGQL